MSNFDDNLPDFDTLLLKYKDKENVEDAIEFLNNTEDEDLLLYNIKLMYPNWIKKEFTAYSKDYPTFTKSWERMCQMTKTKPKKILLVEFIFIDVCLLQKDQGSFNLLKEACDILTRKGYCIRRACEFIACNKCDKALPSLKLYEYMKSINATVPKEGWDICCSFH